MEIKRAAEILSALKENIGKVIVGREQTVELLLTALCCGGHVLLEDVPGTGKTTLAKSLARSLDVEFRRIQFTPDLLPSDVTGLNYYNQKQAEMQEEQAVTMNQIANAIKEYIDKFNAEKQYAMIISTQGDILPQPVAAGDPELDITDALIEGLNAEYVKTKNESK